MFISARSRFILSVALLSFAAWSAHAELPSVEASQDEFPTDQESYTQDGFPATPYLGTDVDMFGNVAIAGMPGADDFAGRAAIYIRDSKGQWQRTATLKASDPKPNAEFGTRVTLTNGRAVVASKTAIYLFVRQASGAWKQTDVRTFAGADHVSDLDWQGNMLAVGVLGSTYANYAFAYDSSQTNTLRKIARFAPSDAAKSDGFGTRIAAYGSTIIATAPGYNKKEGAAYVFTCSATSCAQRQKLLSIDGAPGDQFGGSVDVNGTYLVIGAPGAAQSGEYEHQQGGNVYVFTRAGSAWTQTQTLHPTSAECDNYAGFGYDLTIQGPRLLIGSPYNGDYWFDGVTFEYTLDGGQWSPRALLSYVSGFGASTSLIGQYAIVGSPDHSPWTGEVLFYKLP
ncbi:MAG TPA: hypothetical protein VFS47_12410 [Steroidobacteraceae bacterium]|nr:hypothetical protein [Steroidobacteraceae bacterium]